ncbi:MAG: hypothetical protein LBH08_03270 [Puniceicoccales bacterium]|jgi:hypothetical protein|nr:hypothetical protein [Puniceicoccales bacterium]
MPESQGSPSYASYNGPGFKPGADDLSNSADLTDRLSIFNTYKVLVSYMRAFEKGFATSLQKIEGSQASDIDQGTLLELQAMVQTWGTVAAVATGTVRTVGDTLMKITQNIR